MKPADIALCRELADRPVPEFPGYSVTSGGRVFSELVPAHRKHLPPTKRELTPFIAPSGYAQVTLFRDGKRFGISDTWVYRIALRHNWTHR